MREFTRKELYDLVWSQPMRTVAESVGISDVALAKHCKKAHIPVPSRGYWARKQAGKPTVQVDLPPRFPGASDRVGGASRNHIYWRGSDWVAEFLEMPLPPIPTFDEEMSSLEERVRKLVGKVRLQRKFETVHPSVAKLLAHDEERRQQHAKWGSSFYAPKYDAGIERRRLLTINSLFVAAAPLGCRPSMSTSKYEHYASSGRDIGMTIGESHINFTVEAIEVKKGDRRERLRLAFGSSRDRVSPEKFWEDNEDGLLESRLTEIMVDMLVRAEAQYRSSLVQHREWIVEQKAAAKVELQRRKEEAERKERERQEKLARERIGRLLSQAKALDRANKIRAYVEATRSRAAELPTTEAGIEEWARWACAEADRIDPVKNGTVERAINECSVCASSPEYSIRFAHDYCSHDGQRDSLDVD